MIGMVGCGKPRPGRRSRCMEHRRDSLSLPLRSLTRRLCPPAARAGAGPPTSGNPEGFFRFALRLLTRKSDVHQ